MKESGRKPRPVGILKRYTKVVLELCARVSLTTTDHQLRNWPQNSHPPRVFYSPMLWEVVFHLDTFQLRKVFVKWWFHLMVQNHSRKLLFCWEVPKVQILTQHFDTCSTVLSPYLISTWQQYNNFLFSVLLSRMKLVPISLTETPHTLGRCWTIWGMANWCSTRTWQRKVMTRRMTSMNHLKNKN